MRTKALLGAAILAAGLASSMAQNVYSLNVVGYYNVPVPANQYVMVANQLTTTNNTLGGILPTVPPGSIFQKFGAGWSAYVFDDADLVWTPNASATLAPGEGGFFKSPVATTLTFVGEVKQGSLTNNLPIGLYTVVGSQVPQAGTATALGIPGEPGDIIQKWTTSWQSFVFDDVDLAWTPTVPSFGVGEGFFYKKSPTATNSKWIRNFTVPQ
jgi:hypothetical protein